MSYQHEAGQFTIALIANGVDNDRINRLLSLADRHQILAEIACSVSVGDKFEREEHELEQALRQCCGGGITGIKFGGDPRGCTVKVFLADGRFNTFGGREDGWGVPTREHSLSHVEHIARCNPRHWVSGRAASNVHVLEPRA